MNKHNIKTVKDLFPGDVILVRAPGSIFPFFRKIIDIDYLDKEFCYVKFKDFVLCLNENEIISEDCLP